MHSASVTKYTSGKVADSKNLKKVYKLYADQIPYELKNNNSWVDKDGKKVSENVVINYINQNSDVLVDNKLHGYVRYSKVPIDDHTSKGGGYKYIDNKYGIEVSEEEYAKQKGIDTSKAINLYNEFIYLDAMKERTINRAMLDGSHGSNYTFIDSDGNQFIYNYDTGNILFTPAGESNKKYTIDEYKTQLQHITYPDLEEQAKKAAKEESIKQQEFFKLMAEDVPGNMKYRIQSQLNQNKITTNKNNDIIDYLTKVKYAVPIAGWAIGAVDAFNAKRDSTSTQIKNKNMLIKRRTAVFKDADQRSNPDVLATNETDRKGTWSLKSFSYYSDYLPFEKEKDKNGNTVYVDSITKARVTPDHVANYINTHIDALYNAKNAEIYGYETKKISDYNSDELIIEHTVPGGVTWYETASGIALSKTEGEHYKQLYDYRKLYNEVNRQHIENTGRTLKQERKKDWEDRVAVATEKRGQEIASNPYMTTVVNGKIKYYNLQTNKELSQEEFIKESSPYSQNNINQASKIYTLFKDEIAPYVSKTKDGAYVNNQTGGHMTPADVIKWAEKNNDILHNEYINGQKIITDAVSANANAAFMNGDLYTVSERNGKTVYYNNQTGKYDSRTQYEFNSKKFEYFVNSQKNENGTWVDYSKFGNDIIVKPYGGAEGKTGFVIEEKLSTGGYNYYTYDDRGNKIQGTNGSAVHDIRNAYNKAYKEDTNNKATDQDIAQRVLTFSNTSIIKKFAPEEYAKLIQVSEGEVGFNGESVSKEKTTDAKTTSDTPEKKDATASTVSNNSLFTNNPNNPNNPVAKTAQVQNYNSNGDTAIANSTTWQTVYNPYSITNSSYNITDAYNNIYNPAAYNAAAYFDTSTGRTMDNLAGTPTIHVASSNTDKIVGTTTNAYGEPTKIRQSKSGTTYTETMTNTNRVFVIDSGGPRYVSASSSKSGKGTGENKPLAKYGMGPGGIANAANFAIRGGYKETNGGTHPRFFNDYFAKNGYGSQLSYNKNQLIRNIRAGHPTVLMGSDSNGTSRNTPYGRNPHYVTATGVDSKGRVIIQDPESKYDNQLYSMKDVMKKTSFGTSVFGRSSNKLSRVLGKRGGKHRFGHGRRSRYGRSKFGMGNKKIIFLGDSRFCQMHNAVYGGGSGEYIDVEDDDGNIWMSYGGRGLDWMKTDGIPKSKKYLKKGYALCINMGINGVTDSSVDSMITAYSDYYNENIDEWTSNGAEVYFVSVNPVGQGGGSDNYGGFVCNTTVKKFNKGVRDAVSKKMKYIDTFSKIYDHFKCQDAGLHYDNDTSKEIFDLIVDGVGNGGDSSGGSDSTSTTGDTSTANRRNARVLKFTADYKDPNKSLAKDISDYIVENVSYDDEEGYVGYNYERSHGSSSSDSDSKKSSSKKKDSDDDSDSKSDSSSDSDSSSSSGTGTLKRLFGRGTNEPKYLSKYGRAVTGSFEMSDRGHSLANKLSNAISSSSTLTSFSNSSNNLKRVSTSTTSSNSKKSSNSTKSSTNKYGIKQTATSRAAAKNAYMPVTDNMVRYGYASRGVIKTTDPQYDTKNFFKNARTSMVDNDGTVIYGDKAPLQITPTYHMDTINGKYQKCLRRPKNPFRYGSFAYKELETLITKAYNMRTRNGSGSVTEYNDAMMKAYNYVISGDHELDLVSSVSNPKYGYTYTAIEPTDNKESKTGAGVLSKFGMAVKQVGGKNVYDIGDPYTTIESYAYYDFSKDGKKLGLRPPLNPYKTDTDEFTELKKLVSDAADDKNKNGKVDSYNAKMQKAYDYLHSHNNSDLFTDDYKNTLDYQDYLANYGDSSDEDEDDDDTDTDSSSSSDDSSSGGGDSGTSDTIGSFLANDIADSKVGQVVNSFINTTPSEAPASDGESSGSSGSVLDGKDVRSKTWNWFTKKGYTKAATSGIMGNIEWETFKKSEPGVFPGDGTYVSTTEWAYDVDGTGKSAFANDPGGAGLIQWTPWTAVLGPYCKEKAGDEEAWKKDLSLQFGCIHDKNMTWINQVTKVDREGFMKLKDPEEAAELFEAGVERPGVPSTAKRQGAARWFYENMEKIKSGKSSSSKDDDDDDSKSSSDSGTGTTYVPVVVRNSGLGSFGLGDTTNGNVWWYLKKMGLSDEGAAAVMGNMYAESAIEPKNLQDSYESSLGYTDDSYTEAVDDGKYKKFSSDEAGYGLVQWTSSNRKKGLYDYIKQDDDKSIGDLAGQLEWLNQELHNDYSSLLDKLKDADDITDASTSFLTDFERPADQGSEVQKARASLAKGYYDKYKGTEGIELEGAKFDFDDEEEDTSSDSGSSGSDGEDTIGSFLANVMADSKVGQVLNSFINFNAQSGSASGGSGNSDDGYTGSGSGSDLVKVAMGEYEEGNEGDNNKYNEWMWGKGSTLAWCAAFVAWCADQAGISTDVIPKVGECNTMSKGIHDGGGKRVDVKDAKPGDILFYHHGGEDGDFYHVGIVRKFEDNKLYSVEGNTGYTKGYGEVGIHDDVEQHNICIDRPNYSDSKKSSSKKKDDDDDDSDSKSSSSSNDSDDSTSDSGTGALFGMGTGAFDDYDDDDYEESKPLAKYGTFKESIYGTGSDGIMKPPHPHSPDVWMAIHSKEGTRYVQQSGADRDISLAVKSAKRKYSPSKYGRSSYELNDSESSVRTRVVDNSRLINIIINILYTIADNTDRLNTIVSILNAKLGIDITPNDVSNATSTELLKSKLQSSLGNIATTRASKLNTYADTIGDSSINAIIEAMNYIAAE